MMERVFLTILLLTCACSVAKSQSACSVPGQPSCVCDTPDGRIDLTSIANSDGTPRFQGVPGETFHRYTYSYNPCYGFSKGTRGCGQGIVNAACQEETTYDDQYSCGLSDTETFMYNDVGTNILQYSGGDDGRLTIVELICDETASTASLRSFDDEESFQYKFQLTTRCACPGKCHGAGGGNSGGKAGTAPGEAGIVLIVLSLFGLAMYFIIGVVVKKFKFQKKGIEMLPNHEFWTVLPYLIKDGALLTFNTIKGLTGKVIGKLKKDKPLSDYDKL